VNVGKERNRGGGGGRFSRRGRVSRATGCGLDGTQAHVRYLASGRLGPGPFPPELCRVVHVGQPS
jgi:hypothetical protein